MAFFLSIVLFLIVFYLKNNLIYASIASLFVETVHYILFSQKKIIFSLGYLGLWCFVLFSLYLHQPVLLQYKPTLLFSIIAVFIALDSGDLVRWIAQKISQKDLLDHQELAFYQKSLIVIFLSSALFNIIAVALMPLRYWIYFKFILSFSIILRIISISFSRISRT